MHTEDQGGAAQAYGDPHEDNHALGGLENPGSRPYVPPPPEVEVHLIWTDPVAGVWGGSDRKVPGHTVKKGSTLAFWPSWVKREITYAHSEGARHFGDRDEIA